MKQANEHTSDPDLHLWCQIICWTLAMWSKISVESGSRGQHQQRWSIQLRTPQTLTVAFRWTGWKRLLLPRLFLVPPFPRSQAKILPTGTSWKCQRARRHDYAKPLWGKQSNTTDRRATMYWTFWQFGCLSSLPPKVECSKYKTPHSCQTTAHKHSQAHTVTALVIISTDTNTRGSQKKTWRSSEWPWMCIE